MSKIQFFAAPGTHAALYATDGAKWWSVVSTVTGWDDRREIPAITPARMRTFQRENFYGLGWLAEQTIGINRDLVDLSE